MGTVLVTGASGGLGEEFARQFAARGYDLRLAARSGDKLAALGGELEAKAGVKAEWLAVDLGRPEGPDEVLARWPDAPDILVNNAGFGNYGLFHEIEPGRDAALIDLNVRSLTVLTRAYLPGMVARRSGRVVNVASTAAFFPGAFMAAYFASKAYVLSLSEALAEELKGTGVTVTAFCPGPTKTGFQDRARMTESKLVTEGMMAADTAVREGIEGALAGRRIVVPGARNRFLTWLPRVTSRAMMAEQVRRAQERRGS